MEFIQEIVHQLSQEETSANSNKVELFHSLHKILYNNNNSGKHSVITVDEAQAIENKDIFEELRLLLNFQLDDAFLLTIILLGQPELKSAVMNLPQLSQRMSVRYHIKGLTAVETKEYVQHRLEVAGARKPIFDEEAYQAIYASSLGIPRGINNICDLALLVGFGNGAKTIDKKTILKVSEDLEESLSGSPRSGRGKSSPLPHEVAEDIEDS